MRSICLPLFHLHLKMLHDMYMILITSPYLVFNSYYHEIHPHKEISHSQIGQKAGLNWMVVTPDETPCYHCQVTNNSQDTQQPDTPSRTRGIDHAIATRQGVTLQLWILTAYILRVLRSVTTQEETVHSPWKRWNTTHFLIKKNNQSIKTLIVFNVAQVIKVHVILRQKLTRSKPITWLPLIKQSHHSYGFKWFNLIVQCAQSCWWAKNPKLNWKI